MAPTANQDEDLLIITDSEDDIGNDEILFSFDDENDTSSEDTPIIIGEESHLQEDTISRHTDTVPSDISSESLHLDTETEKISPGEVVKTDSSKNNDEFSFEITSQEDIVTDKADSGLDTNNLFNAEDVPAAAPEVPVNKTPESSVHQQQETHESLNDILTATITKLQKRQDAIATDSSTKSSQEEEIKTHIKKLEEEVSTLESEMKSLGEESDKITSNIEELEGMKLNPVKDQTVKRTAKK